MGRLCDGVASRRLLCRVLLGFDVAFIRFRRHEPFLDRRAQSFCSRGKNGTEIVPFELRRRTIADWLGDSCHFEIEISLFGTVRALKYYLFLS